MKKVALILSILFLTYGSSKANSLTIHNFTCSDFSFLIHFAGSHNGVVTVPAGQSLSWSNPNQFSVDPNVTYGDPYTPATTDDFDALRSWETATGPSANAFSLTPVGTFYDSIVDSWFLSCSGGLNFQSFWSGTTAVTVFLG